MPPPLSTAVPVLEPGGAMAAIPTGDPPAPPAPADPLDADIASLPDAAPAVGPGTQAGSGGQSPAPATPAPKDALDADIAALPDQPVDQAAQLRAFTAWGATHKDTPPDQQAELLQYAAAAGLTPQAAEGHLDELKKTVDQAHLQAALLNSPKVAAYLQDLTKAPLAKDDLASLSPLEWMLTGKFENMSFGQTRYQPPAILQASEDAVGRQYLVYLQNLQALGKSSPEQDTKLDQLEQQYGGEKDYGAGNWFTKQLVKLPDLGAYMLGDIGARVAGGYLGADTAAMAAQAATAADPSSVGSAAAEAPAAIAGATVGQYAGSAAWNYFQARGPLYRQLRLLKGDDGKPLLTDDEARTYSSHASLISGAIMAGLGGKVASFIPGVKQLLAKVGGDAMEEALARPGLKAAVTALVKKYPVHVAEGALLMATQAAVNSTTAEMAKSQHGQTFDWGDVAGNTARALWDGVQTMSLVAGVGAGHELLRDTGLIGKVTDDTHRANLMAAAAQDSKLRERSRPEFEKAVQQFQGDAPTTFYAAPEEWTKYWQGKKMDPGQVAADVMGDGGKAYADALTTGGDIAIPAEKYLRHLADEHAAGLGDFVRLSQDAVSLNGARESLKAKVEAEAAAPAEGADTAELVAADAIKKAVSAGEDPKVAEATGRLWGAAFRTFGKAMGVDALTAYQRLVDVNVVRGEKAPAETGPTARAAQLSQNAAEHPALQELRQAFEKLTPEERARTYYEDPVTGLLNDRGLEALPADSAKPMVGHISVEGIKYRNDNAGHGAADELYRAVAQALHAEDPEAAKVGGDFVVRAKDWKDFNAQLERVREALPPEAKGYTVTGRLGDSLDQARIAHGEAKKGWGLSGKRASRGERPLGLGEDHQPTATIPGDRARAAIRDELTQAYPKGDEAFRQVYTEPSTGLLSKQGFDARPPRRFRASLDLNGLKALNGAVSNAFGDLMLETFGRLGAKTGGLDFDLAHDHGDEYLAQADDREALDRYLQDLTEVGEGTRIEGPGKESGSIATYTGVRFGYGIGETPEQADTALNAHKAALKEAGKRGDELSRLDHQHPEGVQAGQGDHARDHGLDAGDVGGGEGQGDSAGGGPGEGQADQGVTKLDQGDLGDGFRLNAGKGERGYITFTAPEGGKPRRFNIHLLDGADRSTFAHETAHFLGVVLGDVAQMPDASEDLKKDYQTLLGFMGHGSHEERQASEAERKALDAQTVRSPEQEARRTELTAKEERISHAWEQYLMEGKAPSAELAGTFRRFRGWLTRIYRGVVGVRQQFQSNFGENLNLTPDVKAVFDRLLTSDEEVRKAQAATDAANPFQAALEHMTPEERSEYQRVTAEAADKAKDVLFRRITEGSRQENSDFMKGERARLAGEVEQELGQEPAFRTLRFLQEGAVPEGAAPELLRGEDGQPLKLDRGAVARAYGKEFADALPREAYAKEGGVSADELAGRLGWDDGESMVRALAASDSPVRQVADEVQRRMEDLYGPALLDNPRELADMAMDAVHSPAAARKAVLELNALRRALRKGAKPALSPDRAALEKLKDNVAGEKAQREADARHAQGEAKLLTAAEAEAARQEEVRQQLRDELVSFNLQDAKALAEARVRERTVGELTAGDSGMAGQYERTERTMAKRSLEAAAKGDYLAAIAYKERQLVNQLLYRAAKDLRAELETGLEKLKGSGKDAWRSYLGKADPTYRQAHDSILQAIGLQEPVQGQPAPSLGSLLAKAAANAQELGFDVHGLQELLAAPKPWAQLSPDQAENVVDAVTNIRHMARELTEVTLAGKKQDVDDFFAELLANVSAARKPLPPEPVSRTAASKSLGKKVASLARGADALLANTETFAAMLDGEKRDGPAHRLLVDARLEARTKETELQKQVLEPIRKAFDAIPKDIAKLRDKVVDDAGGTPLADLLPVRPGAEGRLAPVYTRDNLWMLFLNWGNEGNKQRIRDGNGWSDSAVEKALTVLSKPETDFLQQVLDSIQSLSPELSRVYEKRTGLPLQMVDATPIKSNGETYRGGYFPLRYDSRYARQGAVQEADVVASLFPAGYTPPFVGSGHTKARLEKVQAPVDLSWGVVPAHMAQVIHDISYGEWVRDAGRLMMDGNDRWRQITTQYLGPEYSKEFIPWLRDVANAKADSAAGASSEFIGQVGGFTRSKLAVGVMGLNVPSLMAHLMDPLTTKLSGVPLRFIGSAYLKTMGRGVPGLNNFISPADGIQLSPEMQYRDAQFTANLRKAMVEMGPNGGKLSESLNGIIFKAHEWLEHFTTTVAYRAAYEHAVSSGKTAEEAVQLADDQVRRNFPSPDIADRPRILRSKSGLAAAVMFYGYANKLYNQLSRAGHQSAAKLATSALYMGLVGAGASYLAGRGPDQDEDRKAWLARKVLLDPLNTIPFLGGAAEALAKGEKVDVRTVPELAFAQDTLNRMRTALKHAEENTGGEWNDKLLAIMQTLVGGLGPVHQAKRTFGYARQLGTGEAQPRGPFDVGSGFIYGKRAQQPANPLTDLQDATAH